MLNVFDLEQQTENARNNSYIMSYFQSLETISESDITRAKDELIIIGAKEMFDGTYLELVKSI